MNPVASLNPFEQNASLQFGIWSVLLHVSLLMLLSSLHFSHDDQQSTPLVKVTLIETPVPKPVQKEAPPLHQAERRQQPPLQSKPVPASPAPPQLASEPVRIAEAMTPPPSLPPPLKRRILQDRRAMDALKVRELTRTASRNTTRTTTDARAPSMTIPVLSTIAALEGVSTRNPVPLSDPATPHDKAKPKTLRARPTGTPATGKVGLGRTIPPVYPRIAKQSGWEGTALVRVTVQANGKPEEIIIRRSSGHDVLDKAAIDAVKKWSFRPAKDGNIPIRSIVEIPIKFSLSKHG